MKNSSLEPSSNNGPPQTDFKPDKVIVKITEMNSRSPVSSSPNLPTTQTISDFRFDETISATFYGRKGSGYRQISFYILSVLTGGLVYLLARWFPKLWAYFWTRSEYLAHADHVFVVDSFGQAELIECKHVPIRSSGVFSVLERFIQMRNGCDGIVVVNYRCNRFLLDCRHGLFVCVDDLLSSFLPNVDEYSLGFTDDRNLVLIQVFGPNALEIREVSSWEIFYNEVLHPFFIFQIASFFIWIYEDYYLYASVILLMALTSVGVTIFDTKKNLEKMRSMTRFQRRIRVLRKGTINEVGSSDICPGDLMILDETVDIVPCDGIMVNGDAIVDESMLSGETVPVNKIEITDEAYEGFLVGESLDQKNALYAGTRLLRSRMRHGRPALLMATQTGFLTAKGRLVQSILFPRPNNFRFYRDSMIFIGIMGVIAAIGFAISVLNFIIHGEDLSLIIGRALDIITVVVPPALPATMAIGTVFALKRLEARSIFCISPPKINIASKVDVFCFDKTGTLTEDGLELFGILPNLGKSEDFSNASLIEISQDSSNMKMVPLQFIQMMASCHSLKKINGRLLGDYLDLKMFECTNWELEEPLDMGEAIVPSIVRPPGSLPFDFSVLTGKMNPALSGQFTQEVGIIRQFDFSSSLRRMSVIVRNLAEDSLHVYCKGSPESLFSICVPETLPADYHSILTTYAHNGYRVIACAGKPCPELTWIKAQKLARESAEKDMIFLGFLIFENRLKDETTPTINLLNNASIPTMMATGDNILTAISVGRACGMLDREALVFYPQSYSNVTSSRDVVWQCVDDINVPFDPNKLEPTNEFVHRYSLAVSGEFFEMVSDCFPESFLQKLLAKTKIFARMSPQQKQLLVEVLQKNNLTVGFCGDGANDCGALKAADVGVSLSQAEASIAAPFTSKIQDISCIPTLIKEGRASLVTSFSCFKYMTLYSMVQFTSLIFLYSFMSSLSDYQFVFVDLLIIVPLGVLMSRYAPSTRLASAQPNTKLISTKMLTCVLGHIAIQAVFQSIVYAFIANPLRLGWTDDSHENTFNPTTTVMFLFSSFLYIFTAVIFSEGRPFRQQFYWPFLLYSAGAVLATLVLLSQTFSLLNRWLLLAPLPRLSSWLIFLLAILYFLVAYSFDRHASPSISRVLEKLL